MKEVEMTSDAEPGYENGFIILFHMGLYSGGRMTSIECFEKVVLLGFVDNTTRI